MSNLVAIQQAAEIYRTRDTSDKRTAAGREMSVKQHQVDAVVALAEWGLFSNQQIASFTGMRIGNVSTYTGKTDASGGRLRPEALAPITKYLQALYSGDPDARLAAEAVDAGVSIGMLSKLSAVPTSTLERHVAKGRKLQ